MLMLGGLSFMSAVHWWDEWQLRIFVLASLAIQFLLLVFSYSRRCAIAGWVRFIMWLAYLAGDAIAIYALATLFNRHKADEHAGGGGGSSSTLEVVWAPVLLIHLGGQDGITAYNIEDNELWSRHLLTAVSQITVAIYVFCKSWPTSGDKRLLQAAILLFVPGVLKCLVKPWAFKRASIYNLVTSTTSRTASAFAPTAEQQNEENDIVMYVHPLDEFVKQAKDFVEALQQAKPASKPDRSFFGLLREIGRDSEPPVVSREEVDQARSKLFIDLSSPFPRRLSILEYFWELSDERAYGSVRQGLATAFLLLYTKVKTVASAKIQVDEGLWKFFLRQWIDLSRQILPWASIGLFHHSHRETYNEIDVKITYVMLCCTAVLEAYSNVNFMVALDRRQQQEQWPKMVSQYSLVAYFARNRKHRNKMWLARKLRCNDLVDQHWCMESRPSSATITKLVLGYLKDGWERKIHDAASYHRFNDNRGHLALEGTSSRFLDWSIKRPFDESVLLWHIATDFCFFSMTRTTMSQPGDDVELISCKGAVLCREMSNYMAYLLFVNPEMLLPGSRRYLFTAAHEELDRFMGEEPPPLDQSELTRKIIRNLESSSSSQGSLQRTFIYKAWMISQALQRLADDRMWEVILGVWVEMLCYSASRCRGYLHAKALGNGGEFLSYVWLLLFHMGMETFTDRLQREEPPCREREGNDTAVRIPIQEVFACTAPPSLEVSTSAAPSTCEIRMAAHEMV